MNIDLVLISKKVRKLSVLIFDLLCYFCYKRFLVFLILDFKLYILKIILYY